MLEIKIAYLSSYTIDLLSKETDKLLQKKGLQSQLYVAPFNQYRQEVLNDDSTLNKFLPQIMVLSISADEALKMADDFFAFLKLVSQKYTTTTIFVHNFILMKKEPLKFLEWNSRQSKKMLLMETNKKLYELVLDLPNVQILDLEDLVNEWGTQKMFDYKFHYFAKTEFSFFGCQRAANQIATAIAIISGKRKKCLVLDLDDTLWGGVLGEEGVENIRLSNDGSGKAFYDFQKQIFKLFENGVILAICSKNDEKLALAAIRSHPYMVLKEDHFAAVKINWANKADNIRAIAEELNIGLDSIVFLDDSEHEAALVSEVLPEVSVKIMPSEYSDYPAFLADLDDFETFKITAEDKEKGKMYVQERQRTDLKKNTESLEKFLRSLGIIIFVKSVDVFSIPRVAQLTQKTNQFNLTTRRYTEVEIKNLADNSDNSIFIVSATDKFGDSGIIGVAIIRGLNSKSPFLDSFLMSCRVLGRGIEQAFLAAILLNLNKIGVGSLVAEYIPTAKNGMAKDFLISQKFTFCNGRYIIKTINNPSSNWIKTKYE